MKILIVAGIGTGVGKTIASAVLTEAFHADYWKPVQSGDLENTDSATVKSLLSNSRSVIHPEAYKFSLPMSPHAAAKADHQEIDPDTLVLPATDNRLIVELAGGLMVPLNDHFLNIDLLRKWNKPVVLVSKNYLGSINHTLLSVQALEAQKISIAGILFNGEENLSSEQAILEYTGLRCLGRIPAISVLSPGRVKEIAQTLKEELQRLLS
jgi:dethiobiotin synthetase